MLSVCSAAQAIGPTLQYNDEVAVGENVTMTGSGNVYIGRDTGNNLSLQNATTIGQLSYAGGNGSVAVGSEANANATNSVAVGANTYTTKDNSVAIGYKSTTIGTSAIAIGDTAVAKEFQATAIGTNAKAESNRTVAIGAGAVATDTETTAVGEQANATGKNASAFGSQATASGDSAVAIGRGSNSTHDNSVAIGSGSVSKKEVPIDRMKVGAATYIGLAGNNPVATFSVGAKDKERQIVNVAAGEVSATSTDAINGSQLYTIAQAVEDLATNPPRMCLTMGSSDNNIGIEWIDEDTYDFTLNKDITNLNSITTNADNGDTTTVTTDGMNIRHYDSPNGMEYNTTYNHNGVIIKRNDGDANPMDEVSLTVDGLNNGGKTIINVKEGSNGTDAVNVNQLNKVREENQRVTEQVTRNSENITQLSKDVVKNTTKITENTKAIEANKAKIQEVEKEAKRHTVVKAGKNTTVEKSFGENGEAVYTVSAKDVETNHLATKAEVNKHIGAINSRIDGVEGKVAQNAKAISKLDRDVRKNRKRADAGTASVAAMANIPQVYLPGKSGVGIGVGYKHGQSAIAVGYSAASDNTKHIVKLSIGADSQKDVTLGTGYMYQW